MSMGSLTLHWSYKKTNKEYVFLTDIDDIYEGALKNGAKRWLEQVEVAS